MIVKTIFTTTITCTHIDVISGVGVGKVFFLDLSQFALQTLLRGTAAEFPPRVGPMAWPVKFDRIALGLHGRLTHVNHGVQQVVDGLLIRGESRLGDR